MGLAETAVSPNGQVERCASPTPTHFAEPSLGGTLYRSVTIRHRDAVTQTGEWQPVWDAMKALAAQHGDDNVRRVVWFAD